MPDAHEPIRQTLDSLIEKRAFHAGEVRKLTQAIETVVGLLPEEEHYAYNSILAAGAEESRFPPDTTLADAAEMVLRHFGEPMRAGPIVKVLRQWGYPYEKDDTALQASLGGILARKAGRGETFEKIEAGLFGLLEWDGETDPDEARPTARASVTPINTPLRAVAGGRASQQGSEADYDDFQPPPFGDDDDDLPF